MALKVSKAKRLCPERNYEMEHLLPHLMDFRVEKLELLVALLDNKALEVRFQDRTHIKDGT